MLKHHLCLAIKIHHPPKIPLHCNGKFYVHLLKKMEEEKPGARSSLDGAWSLEQPEPGAARSSLVQPGAPRCSQEQPGATRSSQVRPEVVRSSQEQPGPARTSQEPPGRKA